MNREVKRFVVELKEDSGPVAAVVKYTRVAHHAVPVGIQGLETAGGRWRGQRG